MIKKNLTFILYVLLATNCFSQSLTREEEEQTLKDVQNYNFENDKRATIFDKAVELNKVSICNYAGDLRSICFSHFAETKNDLKVCDLINHPPSQLGESLEGIYIKDETQNTLNEERDHCIRSIAFSDRKSVIR
jgi:hypothetical protein